MGSVPKVIRRFLCRLWKYLPWMLLLLVVAAGVAKLTTPNPAPWLTLIGDAAIIGLVVLYVIYAVRHWALIGEKQRIYRCRKCHIPVSM